MCRGAKGGGGDAGEWSCPPESPGTLFNCTPRSGELPDLSQYHQPHPTADTAAKPSPAPTSPGWGGGAAPQRKLQNEKCPVAPNGGGGREPWLGEALSCKGAVLEGKGEGQEGDQRTAWRQGQVSAGAEFSLWAASSSLGVVFSALGTLRRGPAIGRAHY